jgi:soluble lytic murein transglycosylase-like protein
MRQKKGISAIFPLTAALCCSGLVLALADSQAQAGILKNGVRVGDRSAMTIFKTPEPGQRRRIRVPSTTLRGSPSAPAPANQSWFWEQHRTEASAATPDRWEAVLDSLRVRRATGKALFSEERLRAIAEQYRTHIAAAARAHGVSEVLLLAVIAVESAGSSRAVSPKGARGLMQLIPATARRFGVADSFDPAENIRGGAAYLDWLLRNFGEDAILALAGYNAGEGAVLRYKGVPPYRETRDYVVKVFDALAAAETLCSAGADTPRRACGWSSTPLS